MHHGERLDRCRSGGIVTNGQLPFGEGGDLCLWRCVKETLLWRRGCVHAEGVLRCIATVGPNECTVTCRLAKA